MTVPPRANQDPPAPGITTIMGYTIRVAAWRWGNTRSLP
jgi:hypothetical protein